MRPPKNPKKSPDEDRSRKKKIKSKSAKRRRDPSFSSDSSLSESELDSRSRRKSSKSKKLEKRRKESKKSERRKSRKKRYRRDSSISSFSSDSGRRSCSTCSDSERSKSPVRKSKSRKRERERGRKTSPRRPERLESSRSGRHRSRRCSTCSRSWGHSRSCSPIERRSRSSRYGSWSCSTCSRSRSHSRSPIEERYVSGHARSPPVEESPPVKERFGSSRGRSLCMDEKETKRLRSVIAVKKTSDEDEDKIIEAYDDYPQNNEGYDDEGNKKRNLDVGNREKDLYDTLIREEVASSKDRGQLAKDSDAGGDVTKNYSMTKESEVVGEDGGKEAADLELILRQKALENLKKFRSVRPANKESFSDKKDECSKLESCQGSQSFMKTSESNPRSSLDDQRHVLGGIDPHKLEARSVADIPTEKIDGNAARDLSNDNGGFKPVDRSIANQNTLNQFKMVHEFSDKMSSDESLLTKNSQNKKIVSLPDSGKVSRAEIDTTGKPASDVLNAENQNCKANEPMVESASGSQFEQKTFSRVCDGETVQVSYKVYIPKKTPALARRQLQR